MKICIVIPAYNEEKRIGETLEAYSLYFNHLKKENILDYELLIIINNTKDNTEKIVKQHITKNNRIKYLNFEKGGKGFAVIEGFKDALKRDNDVIGFVDADMATSPEEYYKLIASLNGFDSVISSRYMGGSLIEPKPTIQRLFAKRLFNVLVRILLFLPFKDTQCGAKIFRRNALKIVLEKISLSQWAFDVDMLYSLKKSGFRIREIPTKWFDKKYSKINFWQAGPWMALGVIRLRLFHSPLKNLIGIYDKFMGLLR